MPLGQLVEPEAVLLVTLTPDILLAVLLLMGHLGLHSVEPGGAVLAGEDLLLSVLGPHVLGEVLLSAGKLAVGEWAVKLSLAGWVVFPPGERTVRLHL